MRLNGGRTLKLAHVDDHRRRNADGNLYICRVHRCGSAEPIFSIQQLLRQDNSQIASDRRSAVMTCWARYSDRGHSCLPMARARKYCRIVILLALVGGQASGSSSAAKRDA